MNTDDIRKNGSGYYDETPYKAINDMYHPGEIWVRNTDQKQVLVMAVHRNFCTVLQLSDHPGMYGDKIAVNGSGTQYTHPGKLMYMYKDMFGKFVRRMAHRDFMGILGAVGDALGIHNGKEGERR